MLRYSLRQLEYFSATAEKKSIAKAAKSLNISQPSVSKAITNLEAQFTTQLFIRHHARGVSLTPAGERLLVDARGLLRYAGELQQHALSSSEGALGELELACFEYCNGGGRKNLGNYSCWGWDFNISECQFWNLKCEADVRLWGLYTA